jgi:hypothetical protein
MPSLGFRNLVDTPSGRNLDEEVRADPMYTVISDPTLITVY